MAEIAGITRFALCSEDIGRIVCERQSRVAPVHQDETLFMEPDRTAESHHLGSTPAG